MISVSFKIIIFLRDFRKWGLTNPVLIWVPLWLWIWCCSLLNWCSNSWVDHFFTVCLPRWKFSHPLFIWEFSVGSGLSLVHQSSSQCHLRSFGDDVVCYSFIQKFSLQLYLWSLKKQQWNPRYSCKIQNIFPLVVVKLVWIIK